MRAIIALLFFLLACVPSISSAVQSERDLRLAAQFNQEFGAALKIGKKGHVDAAAQSLEYVLDVAREISHPALSRRNQSLALQSLLLAYGSMGEFEKWDETQSAINQLVREQNTGDKVLNHANRVQDANLKLFERIEGHAEQLEAVQLAFKGLFNSALSKPENQTADPLLTALDALVSHCGPGTELEAKLCFRAGQIMSTKASKRQAAADHFLRSSKIRDVLYGKNSIDSQLAKYQIGRCHWMLGDLQKAETFLRLAADGLDKDLKKELSDFGRIHLACGQILQRNGKSELGLLYHHRALDAYLACHGPKSTQVANAQRSLATMMVYIQDFDAALEYAAEAHKTVLAMRDLARPNSASYQGLLAETKKALGVAYKTLGRHEEAITLFREYQAIAKRLNLGQGVGYAHSLGHYAECCMKLSRLDEAEEAISEAIQWYTDETRKRQKTVGGYLPSFEVLAAEIMNEKGDYQAAIQYLESARKNYRESKASTPFVQASICSAFAVAHDRLGNREAARKSVIEALKFLWAHHETQPHLLNANEMVSFNSEVRSNLGYLYQLSDTSDAAEVRELYKQVWLAKGSVSRVLRQQNRAFLKLARDPEKAHWIERYRESSSKLSNTILQYLTGDPDLYGLVAARAFQRHRLLGDIMGAESNNDTDSASKIVQLDDLREAIGNQFALVDIFKTDAYQRRAASYLVFVITADGGELQIQLIELGVAGPLEKEIKNFTAGFDVEVPRGLTKKKTVIRRRQDAGKFLAATVWQPIEPALKGRTKVVVCPDGQFLMLPWVAIPNKNKGYLIQDYLFVEQADAQSLVIDDQEAAKINANLLLVGDLDYGQAVPEGSGEPERNGQDPTTWKRLAHAETEVREIEGSVPDSLQVTRLNQFTEREFLRLASRYSYIHIASHGFCSKQLVPASQLSAKRTVLERFPFGSQGVVLTDANEDFKKPDGVHDQWLTGMELVHMDLRHVDLVVLSACHGAAGQLEPCEGVFGLQKAFQLAGVRSLIANRWVVDDKLTSKLVPLFYKKYFADPKKGKAEALRQAQLEFIEQGVPVSDWAGWSLMGRSSR